MKPPAQAARALSAFPRSLCLIPVALSLGLLCANPDAVGDDVSVIASDNLLRMPEGSGAIRLVFRNQAEFTWHDLSLTFQGDESLTLDVQPPRLDFCQPSDRCVFAIAAQAKPEGKNRRFQVRVTLTSREKPALLELPLVVDSTPAARRPESGVIQLELGTITVESTPPQKHTLALTMACIIPLILLLGWGLLLKRKARRNPAGGPGKDTDLPGGQSVPP